MRARGIVGLCLFMVSLLNLTQTSQFPLWISLPGSDTVHKVEKTGMKKRLRNSGGEL